MLRSGFIVALAWISGCAADPAGLEGKLLGEWEGGPCMGSITFRSNGVFERFHYSPGNCHMTGEWKLHWDQIPPLLVMIHQTSSDPDFKSPSIERYRLLELGDQTHTPCRFHVVRHAKKPADITASP